MIEIVPYRPHWADEFAALGAAVRRALADRAVRTDHIGSTSVPGLPAKEIIDMQVTVASLDPLLPLQDALADAGFRMREGITCDHVPAGESADAKEWEKRLFKPVAGRPVNVHVRVAGRANQRYPLLFRDYLRADPAATESYAAVKRALAYYHADDMEAYYAIKDPVCDLIMGAAEIWAATTNWHLGPSDA